MKILHHLRKIARERNFETAPQAHREIQSYIKEELSSYGFTVREESFSYAEESFSNLIASFDADFTKPRWIFGAHFDAVPGSPGADDNGSGVAALLEMAQRYAEFKKSSSPAHSDRVEFVAFDLEEYGMIGSRSYARKLKKEGAQILGMFSLEMLGYTSRKKGSQKMPIFLKSFYPDVGNFIGLVANPSSQPLLKRVKKIFQSVEGLETESLVLPANGWVFPDARLSDHSPFWDEGFPALLVTDTSFFRNPYYHTEKDTIDSLDLDFLTQVTEALARTACELSSSLEKK